MNLAEEEVNEDENEGEINDEPEIKNEENAAEGNSENT